MKLQKSTDQIIITQSGASSIITGSIFVVIGIVIAVIAYINKVPLYIVGIGALFAAIGLFVCWSARTTTTTLNKSGDSTVSSKRIFGGSTNTQTFSVTSIIRIDLTTGIDLVAASDSNSTGSNANRVSTIKAILNDNTEIILGSKSQSSGLSVNGVGINAFQKAPLSDEAKQIADFLGVPLNAADMSNPLMAVQSLFNRTAPATSNPQTPTSFASVTPATPAESVPSQPTPPVFSTIPQQTAVPTAESPVATPSAPTPPQNSANDTSSNLQ